jgi:hypothetical protein
MTRFEKRNRDLFQALEIIKRPDERKKRFQSVDEIHKGFFKDYPNENDRASLDSYSSIYVHWLEKQLIEQTNFKTIGGFL